LKPTPTEPLALLGWASQSFLRSFFSKKRPFPLPDKPEFNDYFLQRFLRLEYEFPVASQSKKLLSHFVKKY